MRTRTRRDSEARQPVRRPHFTAPRTRPTPALSRRDPPASCTPGVLGARGRWGTFAAPTPAPAGERSAYTGMMVAACDKLGQGATRG